jgi:hypothetical protein
VHLSFLSSLAGISTKMAACEYCHIISVSLGASSSSSSISQGEEGEVCFRFTMAISQCSEDSLSQVTEGRTWRG